MNNDDIWKIRTIFISQFVKNVYDPKVMHDNALFEENSYIHVSSTPTTLGKINDAFFHFCKDKYITYSIDEFVEQYRLMECMEAITGDGSYVNYFQDVGKA